MLFGIGAHRVQRISYRLAGGEADVAGHGCLLRDDVCRRRARSHRKHAGRRQQIALLFRQKLLPAGLLRGERQEFLSLLRRFAVRRKAAVHLRACRVHPKREKLALLDLAHERAETRQRRPFLRRAGVPAAAARDAAHVQIALFRDGDHREHARKPVGGEKLDRGAFVDQKLRRHLQLIAQEIHDQVVAADLFLMAGRDVDVPRGSIALRDQLIERLENAVEVALDVHRAAPPELSVGDRAGKRRIPPDAARRDHVLMAHQHQRAPRAPGPADEEAAFQLPDLTHGKDVRKQPPHELMQAVKVLLVLAGTAHRVDPDHARHTLRIAEGTLFHIQCRFLLCISPRSGGDCPCQCTNFCTSRSNISTIFRSVWMEQYSYGPCAYCAPQQMLGQGSPM